MKGCLRQVRYLKRRAPTSGPAREMKSTSDREHSDGPEVGKASECKGGTSYSVWTEVSHDLRCVSVQLMGSVNNKHHSWFY